MTDQKKVEKSQFTVSIIIIKGYRKKLKTIIQNLAIFVGLRGFSIVLFALFDVLIRQIAKNKIV
jgi:hypothetical protein